MSARRRLRVVPATEEGRAALWRGLMRTQHTPEEARLARAWRRYLRAAAERYGDRLALVLPEHRAGRVVRVLSVMEWASIFAVAAESLAMAELSAPIIGAAMRRSFRWAVQEVGAQARWAPELAPVDTHVAELVGNVGPTTRAEVRRVITDGIETGAGVSDIQAALMDSPAFRPVRALAIARTETTRAVSAGTDYALQQAAEEGISVQRQWLSARDSAVRDSHRAMDGQTVAMGERFRSPSGRAAAHPGGFGVAAEDINCRCTVLPIVLD